MTGRTVETLQSLADESLRIVAKIESTDYDVVHIRDDLADTYSDVQFTNIYKNIVAEGLAGRDIGLRSGVGSPEAQIVLYEAVVLFIFPTGEYDGLMVSIDRDAGPAITDVIETTTTALSDSE